MTPSVAARRGGKRQKGGEKSSWVSRSNDDLIRPPFYLLQVDEDQEDVPLLPQQKGDIPMSKLTLVSDDERKKRKHEE